MKSITLERILVFAASFVVAAATSVIFLFSTFQTNADAEKLTNHLEHRLDRIERKVDLVLERKR